MVYDVCLAASSGDFEVIASGISDTTAGASGLEGDCTHYWQVTARDDHGHSTSSPVWIFTTATAAGTVRAFEVHDGVEMEFVWISPGTFSMGSPDDEPGHWEDEGPVHQVHISRGFWLGRFEVTQSQWAAVMGSNPSYLAGCDSCPVETARWDDCQAFLQTLNPRAGRGDLYRLPTEAEWEYACRAGSTSTFCFGNDASELGEYAWYGGNAEVQTYPVGGKKPNAWGLHDIHGNVWEWVGDWFSSTYYGECSQGGTVTAKDRQGPENGP